MHFIRLKLYVPWRWQILQYLKVVRGGGGIIWTAIIPDPGNTAHRNKNHLQFYMFTLHLHHHIKANSPNLVPQGRYESSEENTYIHVLILGITEKQPLDIQHDPSPP